MNIKESIFFILMKNFSIRNNKLIKAYLFVLAFVAASMLSSCGFSSSRDVENNSYPYNTTIEYGNGNYQQRQMVQCPMCGGTGVFDYLPGDVFAPKVECPACHGQGECDINSAQEAMQAMAQAEAIMSGGYGGGYDGNYSSGRSAYEIEYDLRKAYDLLQSMEEDYRNCSSGVIAAQYPSMIANQQERILQLEAELRNAR